MFRSFRAKLILASVLWTSGLLMLMHILSLGLIHVVPGCRGTARTAVPKATAAAPSTDRPTKCLRVSLPTIQLLHGLRCSFKLSR